MKTSQAATEYNFSHKIRRDSQMRMRFFFRIFICVGPIATGASGQVTTIRRPTAPQQIAVAATPDLPLLVGMNSGHALQIDDMAGAAMQIIDSGFKQSSSSAAPVLGRGPTGQIIALVPGGIPSVRIQIPITKWQFLDERLTDLVGMTFDASGGVLYATSCQKGQVIRYDMASKDLQTIGSKGTGLGQLSCPEKIAVDAAGRIYVADGNRVVRMNDITGNGWTSFGEHGGGTGQFNYIRGLAVDRKNRIYVSDYFNNRLVRFDDVNGAGWAEYRSGITQPEGVAVDSYDRMYVALPVPNQILRLDDISGAGLKIFTFPRSERLGGPKTILPMKRASGGGTIR